MEYSYGEAVKFLAARKEARGRLQWRQKPSIRVAQWYEAICPVSIGGVIHEHTRIVVQWRPASGARLEAYNAGLLFLGPRVFAVDYDPDGAHKNTVGAGRPLFQRRFGPGTHVHTPSPDGIGYADPVENFGSIERLFEHFVVTANIDVPGGLPRTPHVQIPLPLP